MHLPLQSEHTHACPSPSLYPCPCPCGCLDRSLLCARGVDVVPLRLQVHRRTLRLRLLRLPPAAAAAAAAAATLGPYVVEAARRPLGTGRDAARRGWLRRRDTPATRLVRGRRICTWYTGYGLRRGEAKARGGGVTTPTAAHYLRDRARTRSVLPGEDARELHRAEALHRALHLVRVRVRVGVRIEVMVGVRARARGRARVGIRIRGSCTEKSALSGLAAPR